MDYNLDFALVDKICDITSLDIRVKFWKNTGYNIVFTNGVFDLVHLGHISYLTKAARLGDKLIIGLNSDASVRLIKGSDRPINNQQSRAALLASLFYVDLVVVFNDDNPLSLIKQIKPHILVKGADYSTDNIVGGKEVIDNGGEVKTIQFIEGQSSTSLINKIRDCTPNNIET
jgi:rfaE bifunctional protein nucleotidyltransferase chain/domain